jgi:hypothetical protein
MTLHQVVLDVASRTVEVNSPFCGNFTLILHSQGSTQSCAFSMTGLPLKKIVGNSPTLSGESGKAWFIWLRVQPPIRLAFWGECWPKRPKARCYTCGRVCCGPTAWVEARRVCGRPRRTRRVSAVRFQQLVSEPGWPSAFSDKSRLTMCEGEIVGNSPTLSGESGKAWFIWLRVQPPIRLAFWGECWPKRPKARCYTCGRVCCGPTAWVGGAVCVGGPDGHVVCRRSGSNKNPSGL